MVYRDILKLPHYSCVETELYFGDARCCEISIEAALVYRDLTDIPEAIDQYPQKIIDELIRTQAVITYNSLPFPEPEAPLVLVVSPHLDDAAYSIGGLLGRLALSCRIHILTLFSVDPYTILRKLKTNFTSLQRLRIAEEKAAASLINATTSQMGWNDALLRNYKNIEEPLQSDEPIEKYLEELKAHLPANPFVILCPLGISHVDHRLTRIIIDKMAPIDVPIFFYDDLPYACDGFIEPEFFQSLTVKLNNYERDLKQKMIKMYVSQLSPGLTRRILKYRDGQERLWFSGNSKNDDLYQLLRENDQNG
ncbi:PIG-L deacetylase family protein [Lacrimispora brassicae]